MLHQFVNVKVETWAGSELMCVCGNLKWSVGPTHSSHSKMLTTRHNQKKQDNNQIVDKQSA